MMPPNKKHVLTVEIPTRDILDKVQSRAIDLPLTIDFMKVRSYGSATETSGVVEIVAELVDPIQGRDVLIVEDIVDTGITLKYLLEYFSARGPRTLKTCVLLDKPHKRRVYVPIDYKGFTVPDRFIVGYGLDFDNRYRNLPFLGVIDRHPR